MPARYDHVVIVMYENKSLTGVIGNHERAEAFDICQKLGLDCVELGTGEFSSDWHVGLDEIVSDDSAVERLNSELAEHGLEYFIADAHLVAAGQPIFLYRDYIPLKGGQNEPVATIPSTEARSPYEPYRVASRGGTGQAVALRRIP